MNILALCFCSNHAFSPPAGTLSGLTATRWSSGWICSSSCGGCRRGETPKEVTFQRAFGNWRSLPAVAPPGAVVLWTWAWPWTVTGTGQRSAARPAAFNWPRHRSWSSITELEKTVWKICTFTTKSIFNLSKDVKYMFIYAAVNSENDILWLLKLCLSLWFTSCLKKTWKSKESLNAARLQCQNLYIQNTRGKVKREKCDKYELIQP